MVLTLLTSTYAFITPLTTLHDRCSSSSLQQSAAAKTAGSTANKIAWNLIDKVEEAGQIGSKAPETIQADIAALANELSDRQCESSTRIPTDVTLTGVHNLLYSMSPGGSSGAIGPVFVGKVTQEFLDDVKFINVVQFGPLKIELHAVREVVDNTRIRVTFQETVVKILDLEVTRKETKGAGVWKQLYVGEVCRDGDRRLLRVMETPSLFVIQQSLS